MLSAKPMPGGGRRQIAPLVKTSDAITLSNWGRFHKDHPFMPLTTVFRIVIALGIVTAVALAINRYNAHST
ncbi:hypothetical protein [Salinisphaera sp.]|uniref:hypothetical protein n=1 Tax=Salinisphaera sp. TaxID=1914330 RepID=UPI003C7C7F78